MAGWGEAIGEGAEAFSQALHPTMSYNIAKAQQQIQAGIQKERLEMDKELQAMQMERLQLTVDADRKKMEDDLKKEKLARESDKLINISKMIGKFPKSEGATGGEKGKGAPKKGQPFGALKQVEDRFGADDETLLGAYELAGKKAPLALKKRIGEAALTDYERELRDLKIESEESLIEQRTAAAEASRRQRIGGGAGTMTERFIAELLDPNTSDDRKALIERQMFGNKTMIDGVPINEISKALNDFYPEFAGRRMDIPENLKDDPVALYRHVAKLLKQTQDGSPADDIDLNDKETTVDDLYN